MVWTDVCGRKQEPAVEARRSTCTLLMAHGATRAGRLYVCTWARLALGKQDAGAPGVVRMANRARRKLDSRVRHMHEPRMTLRGSSCAGWRGARTDPVA
ncbi:hypothetical protein IG631_20884 [Alternaria alternata]|nr:hypothetical protein IG631_20884 [Alternaria alternata]